MAINVALYGTRGRWAMTERGRRRAERRDNGFAVGRSALTVDADQVRVTIDERCAPLPRRVRGTITLTPPALNPRAFSIDRAGDHTWRPLAPASPIAVEMEEPRLSWRGTGYLDMNWGRVPLEATFSHWNWMRVDLGGGESAIFYDTAELSGAGPRLALHSRADGQLEEMACPPAHRLRKTHWRVAREAWAQEGRPEIRRTLEDTPFYARTELATRIAGAERCAIHESLSLRRFKSPIVKLMLPFRMPRIP